jgi:outer membrane protein assembly factor BamB
MKANISLTLIIAIGLFAPVRAADEPLGSSSAAASPARPFGFRGDGSGRFPGATPPTVWSSDKNIRWSAVVGLSYSSPIIGGNSVIVASEPDLLICLNRADGKELWKLQTTPADVTDEAGRKAAMAYELPKNGSGYTAATPITDGQTIFIVFANGIVRAVAMDGKPKWTTCIDAPQSTAYGRAASPILLHDKLIVHMTGLHAFDIATGKRLWTNADAKSTYGTPAVLKVGAEELIVTPAGDVIRPSDGKSVAGGIAASQQSSPIAGADGVIYVVGESVSAIHLGPDFKDTEIWSGSAPGDTLGSPVLVGDTLFIVNGGGQLFAFNANGKGSIEPAIDGRQIVEAGGGGPAVYSSLTLAGKYLFLHSNAGETIVLEATREAKLVAKNQLPSGSGASPVFCGKEMFLRDGKKLYCIGE